MGNRLVVIDDSTGIRSAIVGSTSGDVPTWNNTTKTWYTAPQVGQTGSRPYQISGNFTGVMIPNEVLMTFISDRAVILSSTSTNHQFWSTTLPSISSTISVVRRLNTVGSSDQTVITATFSSSVSQSGNGLYPASSISINSSFTSLSPGDRLQVVAGGTVDANLANLVFTLFAGA